MTLRSFVTTALLSVVAVLASKVEAFSNKHALLLARTTKSFGSSKSPAFHSATTADSYESPDLGPLPLARGQGVVDPGAVSSTQQHVNGVSTTPNKDIDNIFAQNSKWKASKLAEDPEFFNKLGSSHKPKYFWIGCADARVPANEIMGEDAGSVFVVRNVANMVVNTDFNLMSALQYAVDYLQVPHIIVCGHYECGGVRASTEKKDHVPPLENWLRNIRDVYRLHRVELDRIQDPEARHRRLVELNVIEQCLNLFKTGVVQRRRVLTYKQGHSYTIPRIHACVFDPKTGDMKRLQVNFKEYIEDLGDIYNLYSLDDLPAEEAGQADLAKKKESPVSAKEDVPVAAQYRQ